MNPPTVEYLERLTFAQVRRVVRVSTLVTHAQGVVPSKVLLEGQRGLALVVQEVTAIEATVIVVSAKHAALPTVDVGNLVLPYVQAHAIAWCVRNWHVTLGREASRIAGEAIMAGGLRLACDGPRLWGHGALGHLIEPADVAMVEGLMKEISIST